DPLRVRAPEQRRVRLRQRAGDGLHRRVRGGGRGRGGREPLYRCASIRGCEDGPREESREGGGQRLPGKETSQPLDLLGGGAGRRRIPKIGGGQCTSRRSGFQALVRGISARGAADQYAAFVAAEAHRVRERDVDLHAPRFVRDVVEGAFGVGLPVVDRG